MRNKITTEDLINQRFNPQEAAQIFEEIQDEVKKWGGKREGAGRKPKTGYVLEFRIRVSEKEKEFIDYARTHNINYDDLMQG